MDVTGLPADVWVPIASCLNAAADRKAFRAVSRAFKIIEEQTRAEVMWDSTIWGKETRQIEPPGKEEVGDDARPQSIVVSKLAEFPGMRALKLLGAGVNEDELDMMARGFGRYLLPRKLKQAGTLRTYEPAVADLRMLAKRCWELVMAGDGPRQLGPSLKNVTGVQDGFLRDLGAANPSIKDLEVRHNEQICEADLAHLASIKTLRSLNLTNCVGIGDYSPLQHLVKLESLRINWSNWPRGASNLLSFFPPPNGLRCLQLVSLNMYISNSVLTDIGQRCRGLAELKLLNCNFEHLDSQGLAAIAGLSDLQVLHLSCIESEIDPAFQPISQSCTALRSLSITDCPKFSRWALKRLAFNCQKLIELDVSRCKKLMLYEALVDLKLCTNLEVLSIDHCIQEPQPQLFEALAGSLSKLRRFSARGCKGLDQPSLEHILQRCTGLQSIRLAHSRRIRKGGQYLSTLSGLTSCDLTGSLPLAESADETVQALSHCKALTDLSLACNVQMSAAAFREFIGSEVGGRLKQLNLSQNSFWVDDEVLEFLSLGCEWLEELLIAGCTKVHDRGLQTLAACKSLRFLNLSDCTGISLDCVLLLVGGLENLEQLWLESAPSKGVRNLEERDLEMLSKACPSLKKVACRTSRDCCLESLAKYHFRLEDK